MYNRILPWIMGISPFLFLGAKPDNQSALQDAQKIIKCQRVEIDSLRREVECYEGLTHFTNIITEKKVKNFKHKRSVSRKFASFGLFKICPYATFKLNNKFEEALGAYNGPTGCIVTSALREHCVYSLHSKGKAVDIRWNDEGKQLAEWLDTEIGKEWLNKYNLSYYLENIREKKKHPHYLYNKNASGPHVHVYMKSLFHK